MLAHVPQDDLFFMRLNNVNITFINGVVIVIFAGQRAPAQDYFPLRGFRADVCKQVHIGGSGENNNG